MRSFSRSGDSAGSTASADDRQEGQLQEWLEDYEEAQPEHRHLSHLFALYPGSQITPHRTPELAAAARVTLENRNSRADLEDIEFTAALFRTLLRPIA